MSVPDDLLYRNCRKRFLPGQGKSACADRRKLSPPQARGIIGDCVEGLLKKPRTKAITVNLPKSMFAAIVITLAAGAFAEPAFSQGFNAFNMQLLRGSGFEPGRTSATNLTGEWANAWNYGDNFAFVDVGSPFAGEAVTYAEWMPRLSLSSLAGREISAGVVRDVLLAGNVKSGEGFRAYLVGAGVNLDVPGFDFFRVNGFRRNDPNLPGATWHLNMAWNKAFTTGSLHWEFGGFLNWAGAEGRPGTSAYSRPNLLSQPQLMFDLGRIFGTPDRLYAGVEWQIWRNKFGVPGIDESVLQAALKLKL